jgi:hypothetical protein
MELTLLFLFSLSIFYNYSLSKENKKLRERINELKPPF